MIKMDPYKVIKFPLATEKSIRMMEAENKLIFVVDRAATKKEIKEAIEKVFKVKVAKINTFIAPSGEKRAFVKLSPESPVIDIATELGLM